MPSSKAARWLPRQALCVLFALALCEKVASAQPASMAGDSVLVTIAARLIDQRNALDSVWPGFWRRPKFGFKRGESLAFVYAEQPLPSEFVGFRPIREGSLTAVLKNGGFELTV